MSLSTARSQERAVEDLHRNFPQVPTLNEGRPICLEMRPSAGVEVTLSRKGNEIHLLESACVGFQDRPLYRIRIADTQDFVAPQAASSRAGTLAWKSQLLVQSPSVIEIVTIGDSGGEAHAYACKVVP